MEHLSPELRQEVSKMDSLSQALWQYALEERKLEEQRLQRVQQRMQLEEQRLQREQQLEMQRIQLEQQYEDQCRQSEFEEGSGDRSLFMIGDRSLFIPVPKPRTGIKAGIGKTFVRRLDFGIPSFCNSLIFSY